jgi:hypothetical protein
MAAGAWVVHDEVINRMATGEIDTDTDAFIIILMLSTSNYMTTSVTDHASLTNQVATNYGYTQNTKSVTISDSQSSGTYTFDETTNPVWTASGGDIVAEGAVIYDNTDTNKTVFVSCYLDDTPADVTATDGNTLTITMHASGVFTVA